MDFGANLTHVSFLSQSKCSREDAAVQHSGCPYCELGSRTSPSQLLPDRCSIISSLSPLPLTRAAISLVHGPCYRWFAPKGSV